METTSTEQSATATSSTTATEETSTSRSAIIDPSRLPKDVWCSPSTFTLAAGIFLLFFVGLSLFAFVSANTGSAAGLEVTAEPEPEPERGASWRRKPHHVRRAEHDSKLRKGRVSGTRRKAKPTVWVNSRRDDESIEVTGHVPGNELLHETVTKQIVSTETAATTGMTTNATAETTSAGSNISGSPETTRAGLPEAGFRHSSGGPQQLPARSLLCVLGGRSEEYGQLAVDGLCDVALVPFYALPAGGDTFLNDDHAVTQAVLQMAAKAIKTTYGIHVPLKKLLQAKNDLNRQKAQERMKNYWVEHNIYHYAVLDLEIGPNGKAASNVVGRVFAVLKLFAKIQEAIRHELSLERKTEAQPDAYVILGVHLWMSSNDKLFKALQKNVRSFSISALIARTHITEPDHNGCKTNGPAPYEIENNDSIMGMANSVAYVRTFAWVQRTSLAVSFTLCTRWYMPKKEFLVGVDCVMDAVTVSSSGTVCTEKPDFFANEAVDKTQHTAFSWEVPNAMATYDTAETMQWKMCSLSIEYRRLNLAVALFDVECDDWNSECKRPSASHMRGFERTRRMRAYLRGLQSSSYRNGNVTAMCQGMQRKVLI